MQHAARPPESTKKSTHQQRTDIPFPQVEGFSIACLQFLTTIMQPKAITIRTSYSIILRRKAEPSHEASLSALACSLS